jgi:dual specificity phosphatase 12
LRDAVSSSSSAPKAKRVLPWLFVASREYAVSRECLRGDNITHVVFCTTGSSEQYRDNGLRYLTLKFEDDERYELAPMVVLAVDFVRGARASAGTVLIASDRGLSRCAAVTTGVLVQMLNISLRDAFSLVRDAHKKAQPNPGFVTMLKRQLSIYPLPVDEAAATAVEDASPDATASTADDSTAATSATAATAAVTTVSDTSTASTSTVAASEAPVEAAAAPAVEAPPSADAPFCYTCGMCGQILFLAEHVIPHEKMDGEKDWFEGKDPSIVPGRDPCGVHFIEFVKWMEVPTSSLEGKLACPKCKGKLGSFCWRGAQCGCGRWCAPAFRILKDRVDAKHRR